MKIIVSNMQVSVVTAVEPNLYCSFLLFIDSMISYRLLFNSNVFSLLYACTMLGVVFCTVSSLAFIDILPLLRKSLRKVENRKHSGKILLS